MPYNGGIMAFAVLLTGILFVILAITVLKIHPFLALILAAFLVGLLSPVPLGLREELEFETARLDFGLENGEISSSEYQQLKATARERVRERLDARPRKPGTDAVQALELTTREFGTTAASIGLVIVLAAIIGQCLLESGAADKITRRLLALLGEKRAPVALLSSGYFLSIPVFFDTVFFLLVPLARALRLRTGKNFVLYVLAVCAGGAITHTLVPPTPGPLLMVENLSAQGLTLGSAIGFGFLLGLFPAAVGLWLARILDRRLDISPGPALGVDDQQLQEILHKTESQLPGFLPSVLPVLLPVLLISGNTMLETLAAETVSSFPDWMLATAAFLGNKNMALLIGAGFAAALLIRHQRLSLRSLSEKLEPAILSAGVIILITAAGGAFGKMLARSGISDALQGWMGDGQYAAAGYILLGWILASIMKIAQGSGTVAMITASGMMAAILGSEPVLPCHPVYLFAAIGFGGMVFSWMNDSGFWVVGKMSGFSEQETLKTWTPLLALMGVAGLVEVLVLSFLFPMR